MRHGRTHSRQRFFLVPESFGLGMWLLNVGLLLVVAIVTGALLVAGHGALGRLLDPHDPLRRLDRPLDAAERARGEVRASGVMQPSSRTDVPPLCVVTHEHFVSGKGGGWREDYRAAVRHGGLLRTEAGEVLRVELARVRFEPELLVPTPPAHERVFRAMTTAMPAGGRLRQHCARAGQRVFVTGCRAPGPDGVARLTPCGDRPVVVTTGDGTPQRRLDARAAWLARETAKLGAGWLVVLLYLWHVLRAAGPLATLRRIAATAPPRARAAPYVLLALAPVALALALWLCRKAFGEEGSNWEVPRGGHAWLLLVVCAGAIVARLMRRRLVDLGALIEWVRRAPTTPLARAGGSGVELAVRVRTDAPVVEGPLSGRPRAFYRLEVLEVYTEGKRTITMPRVARSEPAQVPVQDDSGQGVLDLSHAELDLRMCEHSVAGRAWSATSRRALALLGGAGRATRTRVIVREHYLEPGEGVYVYGAVRREVDPGLQQAYRIASDVPVASGSATCPMLVYAGSERSLLRWVALEARALRALGPLVGGLVAALALTGLYLLAR